MARTAAVKTPVKLKGTVKSIKRAEGYGFITHEATGIDHFFHRSSVREGDVTWEDLEQNQPVEFTPVDGPKGPRAIDVRPLVDD